MSIVEWYRLVSLVPCEELLPLPTTHLVHTVIRYVVHRTYIIEVFLGIKVVEYHDLLASRPNASAVYAEHREEEHADQKS